MMAIPEQDWRKEYEPIFQKIFSSTDAFDSPLRTDGRLLVFPVPFILDREQFAAVAEATRSVADDGILLSITEVNGLRTNGLEPRHWRLELWDYHVYKDLPSVGVLENSLYSPTGRWGILISHEQHALVGGSNDFIKILHARWPEIEKTREEFIEYWRNARRRGANVNWVDTLLTHIYGSEEGSTIAASIR